MSSSCPGFLWTCTEERAARSQLLHETQNVEREEVVGCAVRVVGRELDCSQPQISGFTAPGRQLTGRAGVGCQDRWPVAAGRTCSSSCWDAGSEQCLLQSLQNQTSEREAMCQPWACWRPSLTAGHCRPLVPPAHRLALPWPCLAADESFSLAT